MAEVPQASPAELIERAANNPLLKAGRLAWATEEEAERYLAQWERQHGTAAPKRPKKLDRPEPRDVLPWSYCKLSPRAYRDPRHSATSLGLLSILAQLARGRASVDAFVDQLADTLGCSRRSVQRAQKRLELIGLLRVERIRNGRINDANRYHLDPAAFPSAPGPRDSIGRRADRRDRGARRTRSTRRGRGAAASSLPSPVGVTEVSPHDGGSLTGTPPSKSPTSRGSPPRGAERSAAGRGAFRGAPKAPRGPRPATAEPVEAMLGRGRIATSGPRAPP